MSRAASICAKLSAPSNRWNARARKARQRCCTSRRHARCFLPITLRARDALAHSSPSDVSRIDAEQCGLRTTTSTAPRLRTTPSTGSVLSSTIHFEATALDELFFMHPELPRLNCSLGAFGHSVTCYASTNGAASHTHPTPSPHSRPTQPRASPLYPHSQHAPLMDKRLEIHGASRADMNGKRGVATDFHWMDKKDVATWRYTVKLDGGEAFKVKPANVRAEGTGGGGGGGGAGTGKAKAKGKKGRKK